MTIAAIIAEYNPFHNGHDYMIQKVKEETGADYVIAVMSGDFTQRGIPGIADKHTRAKMAVSCGADAVFELPVRYATASAELFATGAVSLFNALSCVDYLCFGSEYGKLSDFTKASDLLLNEPEDFQHAIQKNLREGLSYPKAFALAVKESGVASDIEPELLEKPNNLLGLEYLKAIKKLASSIKPHTITRTGTGYHDEHTAFSNDSGTLIASASAIRAALSKEAGSIAAAQPLLPSESYRIFAESYGIFAPVTLNDFSLLLSARIATETKNSLASFLDVPKELADRIYSFRDEFMPFTELIEAIKHKQYTYARINRALIHILLGLKEKKTSENTASPFVPYARLLAMKKSASPLMKEIKEHSQIPFITKPAEARKVLGESALAMFFEDVAAADLYNRIVSSKFGTPFVTDMKHSIELI
ncbi:MAG: nucleotidyltransferase [Lachnospiraceae bacterium]|nr:nucleotidyltransferase [Lachnospiraceae bacterium]